MPLPEYRSILNVGILVFLDGPIVLQPVDLFGASSSNETSTEGRLAELGASEAGATDDPALKPRGWYKANHDKTKAIGLEDSLVLLRETLKERKFDVRASFMCLIRVLTWSM